MAKPTASPTKAAPQKTAAVSADGERLVTLAAIAGAHGIGGEVKLKFFTDDLTPYKSFNDGALTLKSLRGNIARFAEIPDRTAAERLRGTALTIPRSALPPLADGEYYHADLVGLPCVTPEGAPLGEVVAVENFGAGDVIEIAKPDGKTFMVPMRSEAVPEWSHDRLVVDEGFVG
jgi:16S rRNA processing protein RimM